MTAAMSVTLVNDQSEIERLSRLVDAFGEAEGLQPDAIFSLNLALDEVVTNIIRYAHADDGRQHPIVVRLTLEPGVLTAEVEDDGRAFESAGSSGARPSREHRGPADRRARHPPGAIGDELGGIPEGGRAERVNHEKEMVTSTHLGAAGTTSGSHTCPECNRTRSTLDRVLEDSNPCLSCKVPMGRSSHRTLDWLQQDRDEWVDVVIRETKCEARDPAF